MATRISADGLKDLLRSTGATVLRAISKGELPVERDVVKFKAYLDAWAAITTEESATELDHLSRFLNEALTDLRSKSAGKDSPSP
jgi:hypothetical protein